MAEEKKYTFTTNFKKVGSKDNPSFTIPVTKAILKYKGIDPDKKINVVISQ